MVDVNLTRRWVDADGMDLKAKIGRSFVKSCVGSGRNNAVVESGEPLEIFDPNAHFGLFYSLD